MAEPLKVIGHVYDVEGPQNAEQRTTCRSKTDNAMSVVLKASTETCHWGFFDAALPPTLTIESGDKITIDSISGGPQNLPGAGFHVPPELLEMHAAGVPTIPGHLLTGPVAIAGAMPGDVLQVDILDVALRQDWGFNLIRPLAGTLPQDFPEPHHTIIPLDADRGVGTLPWGLELDLNPFFGVMGVAPPPAWGRISTIEPRVNGGNIDNKELVAGTTLYLPVFAEGALFSCGDGHGVQGDGEVCVTAIETALQGRFRLTVLKDCDLTYPQAETPTHYITMGMAPDLDRCVEMALRDMIKLVSQQAGISREDAYMLCSLAGDLRITQTVNHEKGVHMMMAKNLIDTA
ncbi:acetamidase/formamidase family protein [Pseudohalocynthiibacter aestuariivivens]|jgi:acetamidase/formamidase|uniref:Acetamidase/formamidase family protein n=1 Tax=Pseudohalocynthiibacter aestuariivivens TaxID=1591409 RepID=A0ABV5JJN8_9RHOB|nr:MULTISPECIES: acetamidase/formamidase family protein [Pseudohalocynthiibacter]MCK0102727.1 acetamidase/formamidase family protein [Pseudohalocynthiibacter sp. F2068]